MKQYLDLLKYVLENGQTRHNRTGIDTISVFGYQMKFDLTKGFPLLTTKKMFYKGAIYELIWFINGDTNIKYLVDNNVNIWNEWPFKKYKNSNSYNGETIKEFIQKIKEDQEFAKIWGELGPVYGKQWRNFNGVDQLQKIINEIMINPSSRRLIVSSWNPTEVDDMALPPCHSLFQFYVDDDKGLSCQLYQRSGDIFLGIPFNIASYSLLTYMVAAVCGLKPKSFVHTIGDAHIYVNHLEQVKLQLTREPKKLCKLVFKKIPKNITDFKFDDIEIIDYISDEAIKGEVAV